VGFTPQLDLNDQGYDCAVVTPLSVPRRAGKSVKTDRSDAADLVEWAEILPVFHQLPPE
jgi:transposase